MDKTWYTENGTEWVKDEHGNRCSVRYWGSKEAAERALDSLKDCRECVNCSDCSRCSGCSYCSRCSGCSDCSRCSGCSYCSRCSGCSYCSRCSGCSDCSRCSGCSYCSRCSGCSYCSRCSGCSYCSRCSGCSGLYLKNNLAPGDKLEPLAVPAIEDIHKRVYAAVTKTPESLDMGDWHTCETTHCRAGWVVALAGEEGKKLEQFFNTELAAMLIYEKSGFEINPCRFYDSNEAALEDMKRLAETE
jgi:hypothetical protein